MFYRAIPLITLALLGGALLSPHANAGIVLSGTRLIFDGAKREASVNAQNTSDVPYVVQAWVDAADGSVDTPFFVTPAISRIDGKREGLLRVLKVSDALQKDRESMYWLNVKEIPKMDKRDNVLQIAIRTRIKLFYRPTGLNTDQRGSTALKWSVVKDGTSGKCSLKVENNSAFYSTFSNVSVDYRDGSHNKFMMGSVDPFSSHKWNLTRCEDSVHVTYSTINDFGATEDTSSFPVNLTHDDGRESAVSQ
ncbi:molecular chaperone [Burkholderia pseudomultivorans]|uniref:fimbrial biogenesis chaperone n=1 Tax=Burkholderia pseudomultivorans TaxID=1207504 RepID=UPI0009BF0958|nr:molecular chaperone [Burkholderia pseudomultivorans]